MGNDISFAHESGPHASIAAAAVDPVLSRQNQDQRINVSQDHKASASVATEKIQNLRASSKKHRTPPVVSGQDVAHRLQPRYKRHFEPVYRSDSQVVASKSELTPSNEATLIQKLKHNAYQAILLHASATGRNAVLDLSYSVSVDACGPSGKARRVLVTARGTPTVIVQEIPLSSRMARQVPLPYMAV
ncbi:hypothetical protein MPSEU_000735900 [Mayamaea pseudoterrestris]|nr:hypothetical protein MPSEU_000735900 [Mayamaea pseudoterrestris]